MKWYTGNIAEAVATSRSKNAIFVVYVEGTDDKSKNLTSLIDDVDVSTKLQSEHFVALKLEAGSVPHNQFAEIYKNVPVPSLFFIGKVGLPLDIITEIADSKSLLDKINNVIFTHTGSPSPSTSSQSLIAGEQAASQTSLSASSNTIENPVEPMKVENVICENGVCKKVSADDVPAETSVKVDDITKDDKIEHAKKMVEKKREEKKVIEQESERQKEIERRKLGQDVQKLKEWQKDQELKELMEKRKKEKIENKQARDRILQQIAQDKADRAAKFGTAPPAETKPEVKQETSPRPATQPNSARLQFKLPDGSSSSNTFENYTLLSEVRTYITDNLNLPFRNFKLATTFPRREFTQDDNHSTLFELGLCPTSVILIIPMQTSVSLSHQPGGPLGIVWVLLSPIFSLFNMMRNLVFGSATNATGGASGTVQNENKRSGDNLDAAKETLPKRRVTESTTVRRQGNIHRFTDRTDSDDENNTWNGNSTQQM